MQTAKLTTEEQRNKYVVQQTSPAAQYNHWLRNVYHNNRELGHSTLQSNHNNDVQAGSKFTPPLKTNARVPTTDTEREGKLRQKYLQQENRKRVNTLHGDPSTAQRQRYEFEVVIKKRTKGCDQVSPPAGYNDLCTSGTVLRNAGGGDSSDHVNVTIATPSRTPLRHGSDTVTSHDPQHTLSIQPLSLPAAVSSAHEQALLDYRKACAEIGYLN